MTADNSKTVIIGAGNVGWHLGLAFTQAGIPVEQVYSRSEKPAKTLAEKTGASFTTNPGELIQDAKYYLIAVPDDAIGDVVSQCKFPSKGMVAHTSGMAEMELLKKCGTDYGVFYPLQTFTREVPLDYNSIPIFIEAADSATSDKLTAVAQAISEQVKAVDSHQRFMLHISAVFAANFTNHMYSIASKLLSDKALDFKYLHPLITEVAHKALKAGPKAAQTGPAIRGDIQTIHRQLFYLQAHPEWQPIYQMLTDSIQKMYDRG